ncbi:fungal specific transcription factor domain-containing protein [Aspergillus puulaauensis]|uniref:Xylanolytic transcriptional activator regulatory domain-containing protein n=1 Tax=Aspergillus puulaauensis TaxID=1220207 RepID=A0A7R7XFD5_9EURO|nr:uncharacterized protein APUU_20620S [Aspergillus puulaauensis]BCS20188.1 hypothetical protein APUU_20620S [Aspergillus puulaauensis]
MESARGKWPRPNKGRKAATSTLSDKGEDGTKSVKPAYESSPTQQTAILQDDSSLGQLSTPYQDSEVYLGESTLLRAVHSHSGQAGPYRSNKSGLRYPLPAIAAVPDWEIQRRQRRLEMLSAEGAMIVPDKWVQDGLFGAYFRWFHICFPVVNKEAILRQSQAGDLSPMLCHAMMFIGVIHCKADKLKEIGLGNGEEARHLFYNRAKDLYDADFESNSLTQLQVMFLLSFWRAGPLLQKDCRYWLGGAIALAQKKAMHRSFSSPDVVQAKLRKRIWWSIYVRERQCAAALGLPNRIRDEDCDVASLTPLDFDDIESASSPALAHNWEHVNYAIEMAKLAGFLGKIVWKEYTPNSDCSLAGRTQLKAELNGWYHQLPDVLRLGNEAGGLFVGMLHMAYNNLLILLSRRAFIAAEQTGAHKDSQIAYHSACRISRIAEDLLAEDLLGYGQIHLITCLFNALCIHTVNLRRVEGTSRLVAEHRAKICLYGLRELQKTWEVTNWILQLFFQYLDRSMAGRLQTNGHEEDGSQAMPEAEEAPTAPGLPITIPITPRDAFMDPNELGVDMPLSMAFGSDSVNGAWPEGNDGFWSNALSSLDGITPVDLELLAGCLT